MELNSEILWKLIENSNIEELESFENIEGISKKLNTDLEKGINTNTINERINKFGKNEFPLRPIKSFYSLILDALSDQTIIILIICAIATLVLEFFFAPPEERSTSWIDGSAILFAVIIVSLVQAYNNFKQELQFSSLNRIKSIFDVSVKRNGILTIIKNNELVVGDIVLLHPGDSIPADGLLITYTNLRIDQSAAFGESQTVKKDNNDPFLLSNTHVAEGFGSFLVICVGLNSHHGKMFSIINDDYNQTPLQEKLEDLAAKIGYMGIFVATLTFLTLFFPWLYNTYKKGWSISAFRTPLSYFVISLTIIACAVPEGLPLAVTISLAYSMRQMMNDNNFVRQLSACETMGSATTICTDKTGTLTQNLMTVEHILIGLNCFDILNNDFLLKNDNYLNLLRRSIAINTTANLTIEKSIGSQTECALLRFCELLHGNYEQLRNISPISKRFLFDQNKKTMSTIVQQEKHFRYYIKGAPDVLISKCSQYLDENGNINLIDSNFQNKLIELNENECDNAYRTLLIAYKDSNEIPECIEDVENNLILIGIVSIRDSLRINASKSINDCQNAGIHVIMITGDHKKTAESIGKDCGIFLPGSKSLTGYEIRNMNKQDLLDILPHLSIVSRSSPMDKHLIVKALQEIDEVVGVTGDGTNDVPALMAADVGLSMGKSGTELAKEASDIVILDDDFKSIVMAIIWGRSIYKNIRKFLQFQLTANIVTLFVSFISAVVLQDTPFKAVQLLWVNLIMDSFGALALSTSKPNINLLNQSPERRNSSLINSFMILNISSQSLFQIILIGIILIFPINYELYSQHHYTFLFNTFVLCQMFNLINASEVDPIDKISFELFKNKLFLLILIGIGLIQFILVQFIGEYFSCNPLSMKEWISSLIFSSLSIPIGIFSRKLNLNYFKCFSNINNEFQRL